MGYGKDDELAINTIRLLAVSRSSLILMLPQSASVVAPLTATVRVFTQTSSFANLLAPRQVDATFTANSGHPGAPMGMAPVAHILFNKFMTFNPKNPDWVNRDRFVLS